MAFLAGRPECKTTAGEQQSPRPRSRGRLTRCIFCTSQAIANGRSQWNIVHKHHAFWHLQQTLEIINPRFLSTYSEESMMKSGTLIYAAMATGLYFLKIQRKVLLRYLNALQLMWCCFFA